MRWFTFAVVSLGSVLAACSGSDSTNGGGIGNASAGASHGTVMKNAPALRGEGGFEGIGRIATASEVAAWDIDVRPDFQGLPPGEGSVTDGEEIWIEKCASCHGDFGDAGHMFFPLIGNTTLEDIETGHVAALKDPGKVRTSIMKIPYVSTLWDFIYRAMPWNAPKTLTPDEVYALVAYMLYLAEVVPDDHVLSNENIAEAQARMPNRNGVIMEHGLWSVGGKPDVTNTDCMKDCAAEPEVASELPEYAYDAHGDLSIQTRPFGPARGWKVGMEADGTPEEADAAAAADDPSGPVAPTELMTAKGCLSCHGMDHAVVGPSLEEVRSKYVGQSDAADHLRQKIRDGGAGVWGQVPMPPQPGLSDEEVQRIVDWLAAAP